MPTRVSTRFSNRSSNRSSAPLRALMLTLALAAIGSGSGVHAAGKVEVSFVKPEQFADAGFASFERERNLRALTEHFQSLAKKLPDSQTLRIEVLDVDLAGRSNPASPNELRVLRGGADWPRIKLHYTLDDGARTVKSADQDITDMNYTFTSLKGADASAPLGYEKRMLERWFDQTFGKRR